MIPDSRILRLEGVVNFRDLGGLPTTNGRVIRRGRLFRRDFLYRLTEDDVITMRPLGIRTVIDLRSPGEIHHYPKSPLKVAGLQHFNVSITSDIYSATDNIAEDCLLLLHNAREGFRTIFSHLAADPFPLVINCFAGKDRTGLTSALILGALGVPEREIVADYALSERHISSLMHIHPHVRGGISHLRHPAELACGNTRDDGSDAPRDRR